MTYGHRGDSASRRETVSTRTSRAEDGADDSLAGQNRAFAATLTALGIPHRFFVAPGTHSWRLWRGQMPQALITASEYLSHG